MKPTVLKYFFLIFFLLSSFQSFAVSNVIEKKATSFISGLVNKVDAKIPLSDDERELLVIIGLEKEEVENLSVQDLLDQGFRDKVVNHFNTFGDRKVEEIKKTAMKEFVPGLASSTIGLGFASFLAVETLMICPDVTSARVAAGSSALWVGMEMMIWDGYKIEQERIKQLGKTEEFNKKLKEITQKVEARWKVLRPKIKEMEKFDNDNLDLSNQQEGMGHIKAELNLLRKDVKELVQAINIVKEKQFDALDAVAESINRAQRTTEKKAKNAKLAAIGFTGASAIAAAEVYLSWNSQAYCKGGATSWNSIMDEMFGLIIPQAYAGVGLSDFDKIGIPVGAAAGYLVFRKANKVKLNVPHMRALSYAAMAANAMFASAKLKKSADYLKKQHHDVEVFSRVFKKRINQIEGGLRQTDKIFNFLDKTIIPGIDHLLTEAQKIIDKGKAEVIKAEEKLRQEIADLSPEEIEKLEKKIKDARKKAEDIQQTVQVVVENEDTIQSFIDDAKDSDWLKDFDLGNLLGQSSYIEKSSISEQILNFVIPQAVASVPSNKATCLSARSNFVRLDKDCQCKKSNSCYEVEVSWPSIPKKHESWLAPVFKMSAAHMKALNTFSQGEYELTNQYVGYINQNYSKLDKVHQGLMGKLQKRSSNPVTPAKLVQESLRERKKDALAFYRSPNSLGSHVQKAPHSTTHIVDSPVAKEVQGQLDLMKNFSDDADVYVFEKSVEDKTESKEHSEYVIESIEKNSQSDIFELISHRYYVKYFDQL